MKIKVKYIASECYDGCTDLYCPYTHSKGWFCVEEDGNCISGPFASKEAATKAMHQPLDTSFKAG